jgi:cytochrome c oxidase subunit 2
VSDLEQQPAASPSGEVNHIRRVLRIWAILSVIGVILVILLSAAVNPSRASSVAGFASLTDLVFTALAVPVGLFVWVFIFYSVFVFRERGRAADVDQLSDGPALEASPKLQIWWLAITGGLAIFLVGWGGFGFLKQTTDSPPNPLVVDVTGQQWFWTYDYPSLGVKSATLELPVGRPISFHVTSDDVLHGFAVEGLDVLVDANPGWWTTIPTVTPDRTGTFATRCVELCGLYHTYMWSPVHIVEPSTFANWVSSNGGHMTSTSKAGA